MPVISTRTTLESHSVQTLKQESRITIRPASLEDIDTLGDLWYHQRCYHEQWDELYETAISGQQKWKEYIISCLSQSNQLVLVAEDDQKKIIGYIHGSFYPWPFSPFEIYGSLNTIAISPEAQGQGTGKKLVQKLLNWFKEQKIQHISVHVDYRNEGALHLYKNTGFRSYQHRLMLNLENSAVL
ncbi:MAG: GNAT family N-acetyltransferase [Candidatus Hodarchaeota archaeon]